MAGIVLNKLILFLCGAVMMLQIPISSTLVVSLLISVTISALNGYYANKILSVISALAYCILCAIFPEMGVFLPLISYDIFSICKYYFYIIPVFGWVMVAKDTPESFYILVLTFIGISYYLHRQNSDIRRLRKKYLFVTDNSKELTLNLEVKNKELIEQQDYEVHVATLTERNRIAREIHDNVGHLLSRSILQVGALMAVSDGSQRDNLNDLRDTLANAMDSIRTSVHDLHDDAFDLYTQVKSIVDGFSYCEIELEYDVHSDVSYEIKYSFIAIIKEALSNIIKHSDASFVRMKLREHPGFYQLVICDNGHGVTGVSQKGLGIDNMKQRIDSLGGVINISKDNKFEIFISVPRKGNGNENSSG